MPNLWSNTKQTIYEALVGPRTIDLDFNDKLEELKNMYKSVEDITNIYKNIQKHLEGMKYIYMEINHLKDIFHKESPYYNLILSLIETFQRLEINYDILNSRLNDIENHQARWFRLYNEITEYINKREEYRRIYDHYDEKLENLNKRKIERDTYLERNEHKYRKAREDYANYSLFAYKHMQALLDFRHNYINPCIIELINSFAEYYTNSKEVCYSLWNIKQKFDIKNIEEETRSYIEINYDPYKHMREDRLYSGINVIKANITEQNISKENLNIIQNSNNNKKTTNDENTNGKNIISLQNNSENISNINDFPKNGNIVRDDITNFKYEEINSNIILDSVENKKVFVETEPRCETTSQNDIKYKLEINDNLDNINVEKKNSTMEEMEIDKFDKIGVSPKIEKENFENLQITYTFKDINDEIEHN